MKAKNDNQFCLVCGMPIHKDKKDINKYYCGLTCNRKAHFNLTIIQNLKLQFFNPIKQATSLGIIERRWRTVFVET